MTDDERLDDFRKALAELAAERDDPTMEAACEAVFRHAVKLHLAGADWAKEVVRMLRKAQKQRS